MYAVTTINYALLTLWASCNVCILIRHFKWLIMSTYRRIKKSALTYAEILFVKLENVRY